MAKKNFILLSLEDKEAKKVANVIGNDSCKKIIDYLAEKEGTETEIAKALSLPMSTVHYNLQQLVESGLVEAEEYHYSQKGKEMLHYKLANKYIIITPKKITGLKEKLRGILPTFIMAGGAAFFLYLLQRYAAQSLGQPEPGRMMKTAVADTAQESFAMAATAPAQSTSWLPVDIALWFLVGVIFALVIIYVVRLRKG